MDEKWTMICVKKETREMLRSMGSPQRKTRTYDDIIREMMKNEG